MEELLKLLEQIYEERDNVIQPEGYFKAYFKDSELLNKIEDLCCEHLITNGAGCNWDNINYLRQCGYLVFAGEKDSFGWLTGCIQKNGDKRVVVYG